MEMQPVDEGILLTIAIPTYNRSKCLDMCLAQIWEQLRDRSLPVEILVSDNNSTDDTREVISRYQARGFEIRYSKNQENIGADCNFIQCLQLARGKYFLLFGDDDVFLDGSIEKLVKVLQTGEYGVVFMKSFGFTAEEDIVLNRPQSKEQRNQVYDDLGKYLREVHYWVTFISANVINRTLIDKRINLEEFVGTCLLQLSWTLPAILRGERNVVIHDVMFAARADNTGGYALCQVFGVNFNRVFDVFINLGYDKRYFDLINRKLLTSFFPYHLLKLRGSDNKFADEEFVDVLKPVFKGYIQFWLFTVPIIKLPLGLAKGWFLAMRVINKFYKIF